MFLSELKLSNFRCFPEKETTIEFEKITTFIGSNGTGKSAALQALFRIFGSTPFERNIQSSDFHVGKDEKLEDKDERTLRITAKLTFPELNDPKASLDSIPELFQQMRASADGNLFCLIELSATWRKGITAEGDIEQELNWILPNDKKRGVKSWERSRIAMVYVPATRNPQTQVKQAAGTALFNLLNAVEWSEDAKTKLDEISPHLQKVFSDEQGIKTIEKQISTIWGNLFQDGYCKDVRLSTKTGSIQELLSRVEVSLLYSEQGNEQSIDSISDGMKSLFYLTLISSVFETEQNVFSGKIPGLRFDKEQLPIYTIFGIEEPENHLAPHYLSRIMGVLQNLGNYPCSQVILTSHSPSIMKRISPEQVRHFRIDLERNISVSKIVLPADKEEVSKYVKQAIIAHPELYFSRLVILGEGDSEEIILPRMGKALGIDFEEQFISVVPLGGRHVNHFWRLLNQLNIPHITLLDLDNLRAGGDWKRIAYILEQGKANGLRMPCPAQNSPPYDIKQIKGWTTDINNEEKWFDWFSNNWNVFFSSPIDIDWTMFQSYRDEYQSIYLDYQNSIPAKTDTNWEKKTSTAIASVYKTNDGIPTPDSVANWEDYFWYRYIFLGRGKPSSHALMLSQISDEKLRANCPDVYRSLIAKAKTLLDMK